ncbi:MAG: tRNA uridine-5-carboxymethylaminomethyl(34) synthesis GTPase MnmE [Candidatus Aminicenantes bacterium]|nr:tRNA uridine-5-carboxymethylaminomethyl(34) synthesis GTPase MnmE [Candidatus Aminicenantes bacterium]
MDDETIVALATPPGQAGIAVIRLSGSKSHAIVRAIFEPLPGTWHGRKSYHGFIHSQGERVDECLVTVFKAPRTYCGEDMAEISLHSNLAIIEAVIDLTCRLGARPALPGEFTYRAFRNGKMDLLQAEAVNELIRANSRVFALMEFGNLEGRLSHMVGSIRARLLEMAVAIETDIEFAEDQRLETDAIDPNLEVAINDLEKILGQSRFNETLDQGMQIVIAGRVNVGKSSLFNALLMKERSIISHLPGTTRDYIQEKLHIDGWLFRITDMAGIREGSGDDIENQGMRRSRDKIAQADAVIFMVDASQALQAGDQEIFALIRDKNRILLANKKDLAPPTAIENIRRAFPDEIIHLVSAKNGENLEPIIDFLKNLWRQIADPACTTVVNLRQKTLLAKLLENLRHIEQWQTQSPIQTEMIAEDIRRGLRLIGELTGAVSSAEILQGIFAKFCIGK